MAKDYAKMYEKRKGKPSGGRPSLLIAVVCVVMGVAAVMVFHGGVLSWRLAKLAPQNIAKTVTSPTAKSSSVAVSEEPVKFDFYSELPATVPAAVGVASHSVAAGTTGKPAVAKPALAATGATSRYFLQLGIFSDKRAAARVRLNFLLAGVDSVIVQEKSAKGDTIFRIQQGPYLDERTARAAESKLHRKGIDVLMRKVVETGPVVPT